MNFIRNWTLNDSQDLAQAINDKEVQDNLRDGLPFPYTNEDALVFINGILNVPKDLQYSWAIHVNGKAVGSIGIYRKSNIHNKTAEIGYFIAKPYWGQGIVTNAVKEACIYIFKTTDIIRIFAEPFSDNLASCRVLEKAGFKLEGILRKNAIKNEIIKDMKMYSLIKKVSFLE